MKQRTVTDSHLTESTSWCLQVLTRRAYSDLDLQRLHVANPIRSDLTLIQWWPFQLPCGDACAQNDEDDLVASLNDMTRFICLFHSSDRAHAALRALEDLGFPQGSVSTIGDGENSTGLVGSQSLTELGVPDRDLEHLQQGIRDGGVLVSLQAPEGRSNEIEKIFHRFTAEKIDETELRSEVAPVAAAALPAALTAHETVVDTSMGQAVLPIAEEELVVGKRAVDRGGVRVFQRTVEEPVQQNVTLHGERVVLEYREVNRPATEADVLAGTQQIELVETAEVPVVEKVARVVEEVRVGKEATDHTQVVQDTVRHTEVDVQPIETTSRSFRD